MRDLIIVGGWVWDNVELGEPSGVVRAFNAETGELVWAWDLGNPAITKLPPEGESYTRGTPNVWSTPAFDDAAGPRSTCRPATPRPTSGARAQSRRPKSTPLPWSRSTSPPAASAGNSRPCITTSGTTTFPRSRCSTTFPTATAARCPALIQVTKRGQIFVLDRRNGKPIAEVEEKPVPQGPVARRRMACADPALFGGHARRSAIEPS